MGIPGFEGAWGGIKRDVIKYRIGRGEGRLLEVFLRFLGN